MKIDPDKYAKWKAEPMVQALLEKDIKAQRLARSKFASVEEAEKASWEEAKGLDPHSAGACVGINYADGRSYRMSGHIEVPDETWDQTGGLCWRCAWYAAYRLNAEGEWVNEDEEVE